MRVIFLFVSLVSFLKATQISTGIYKVDGEDLTCNVKTIKQSSFDLCEDGTEVKYLARVSLPKPNLQKAWLTKCTQKCLDMSYKKQIPGKLCVGFVRSNPKVCSLAFCNDGNLPGPLEFVERPQKARSWKPPIAAVPELECFGNLVKTKSPTPPTPPTRTPTTSRAPTQSPIPKCNISPTAPVSVKNSFAGLEGDRVDMHLFKEVKADPKLCEYFAPRPGYLTNVVENFQCTLEACIRWCRWDDFCFFAMYNQEEQRCWKSQNIQLSDDSTQFQLEKNRGNKLYMRTALKEPDYFNARCNALSRSSCTAKNTGGECSWKKGKLGWNQELQGGTGGGWCGRIKCNSA